MEEDEVVVVMVVLVMVVEPTADKEEFVVELVELADL